MCVSNNAYRIPIFFGDGRGSFFSKNGENENFEYFGVLLTCNPAKSSLPGTIKLKIWYVRF